MKPFKTIDEQYTLLLNRGLSFSDEEKAKRFLLNNNYYNVINCYAKFFMDENDKFKPKTNFDEITQVHYYDKEIKSIFFKYIIEIEKHLKSILAYRFSEKYQDQKFAYLIASNYNNKDILQVTKNISSLSKIISHHKEASGNNPIKHYINNHDDVPFWIVTNYMQFGQLLYFLKHLDASLKNKIAKDFSYFLSDNLGINQIQLPPEDLISFLENVLALRNVVAHNNRLLGFNCKGHVHYLPELHNRYMITNDSSKQDVYNVFIVMQCLLSKNQYALLHNTLRKRTNYLHERLKAIDVNIILNSLGFPADWFKTERLSQPK